MTWLPQLPQSRAPASPGSTLRLFDSAWTAVPIVSPPYFTPGDGIYSDSQNVVIGSGTPGASVIYTTDGSTPSPTNGMVYSGPVSLNSETVVRAMAIAPGMANSAVNTAIYNFPGTSLSFPPPPPMTSFGFLAIQFVPYMTNGAIAAVQTDSNLSLAEGGSRWKQPVRELLLPITSRQFRRAHMTCNSIGKAIPAAAF